MRPRYLAATVAALGAALLVAGPAASRSPDPVPWSRALADEADTTIFATTSGLLLKAPFHLATPETLWSPRRGEQLSRVEISPDGRKVAWLTRSGDEGMVDLWIASTRPDGPRVRFRGLKPATIGRLHFEAAMPSTRDPGVRGARLIVPGPQALRPMSTTLQWMPDGSAVAFGYDDGLAYMPADSGSAIDVSKAWIVALRSLDPSAVFLADLVAVVDDKRIEGWHLIYPTAQRWRVFSAAGLGPESAWTASSTTVWWAGGTSIRAVRANDPTPHVVVDGHDAIAWLGYVPARRELLWAAGQELRSMPEDGTTSGVVARFKAPIRRVLESQDDLVFGVIAGDSIVLIRADGAPARTVSLGGLDPDLLFTRDSSIVLAGHGRSGDPVLARWSSGRAVVPIDAPRIHHAAFFRSPSGARILIAEPGHKAPATFQVYEIATDTFTEVLNPGLAGWEPFRPR